MPIQNMKDIAYLQLISMLFALIMCIVIETTVAILLWQHYHPFIPLQEIIAQFLPSQREHVNPKPAERLIFITLLLLLPLASFISVKLAMTIKRFLNQAISRWLIHGSIFFAIACFVILLFTFKYENSFTHTTYRLSDLFYQYRWMIAVLLAMVGAIFYSLQNKKFFVSLAKNKIITFLLIFIVLGSIVLQSISFRIADIYAVNDDAPWSYDFEPVFYSVAQVYAGKTMLAHMPALYGMYSEILNPIFNIIGLNVFHFTLMMALFEMSGLFALFFVLYRLMKSQLLILFCMLSLIFLTGMTWYFIYGHGAHPYYQYFPIRFFFPATSVFIFFSMLKNHTFNFKNIILFSCFAAIAMIWNMDSGVPIFGSFLVYLSSFIFFESKIVTKRKACYYLAAAIVTVLILYGLFLGYLQWKAGEAALHLAWIYKYQKIFYQAGYMMLPIPKRLDPWLMVVAIYMFGVVGTIFYWIQRYRTMKWDMIFYLSILGLGLFAYYEGRSHIFTLIAVAWPALLILFILCDDMFRLARLNILPKFFLVASIPLILFGFILSANFIYAIPKLCVASYTMVKAMIDKNETTVTRNVAFMRQYLNRDKETVIITSNQAVYFGELGLSSAISGPGMGEVFLVSDDADFKKQLTSGVSQTLFFQLDQKQLFNQKMAKQLNQYHVVAVSQDHLAFLKKRDGKVKNGLTPLQWNDQRKS